MTTDATPSPITLREKLDRRQTIRRASDRFQRAAQLIREARSGRPTARLEHGQIIFTYPDGTETVGGDLRELTPSYDVRATLREKTLEVGR